MRYGLANHVSGPTFAGIVGRRQGQVNAQLELGEGRGFVFGKTQDGIQAHHAQRLHHQFGGRKKAASTSSL